tara:strand:- start:837 stop:2219 length:1383 start_codon:yes stop_codon:yes gene_type:complete
MESISRKWRILPLTRNQNIKETAWHAQITEAMKAVQIVVNEYVRIAGSIENYPEFQDAKGAPNFTAMNKLISQWRTKKEGLDNLPEFKYKKVKKLKTGGARVINKSLKENRYMNDEGECWGYEILNKVSARCLNHIAPKVRSSWYTKGKVVKYFAEESGNRLPVHPTHFCDGGFITTSNTVDADGEVIGGEYSIAVNKDDPAHSRLNKIAGIKEPMRLQAHHPIPEGGKMKTVSVAKEGDEFYLCITIALDPNTIPPVVEKPTQTIGLDFGIKDNVIDDQNNKYNFPKDKKLEGRILRLQQEMSLKKRGSNNWRKLLGRLQRLKRQQTRQHKHAIHNFTHQITNNYDGIAFEDYKVKAMVDNTQKDKKLFNKQKQAINKKSLEAGIYDIKNQLTYKSALRGNVAQAVDPAYTTQDCSCCGFRNTKLSNNLKIREWVCPECGTHHKRDQNSAKNMKKAVFG